MIKLISILIDEYKKDFDSNFNYVYDQNNENLINIKELKKLFR